MTRVKGSVHALTITGIAAWLVLIPSSVLAAPNYPPTIEAPTVNEEIIAPVAPKANVNVVVVPKATSEDIPELSDKAPVKLVQRPTQSVPTSTSTPIQVTTQLILGGVKKSEVADTPIASVSSKKGAAEIQVVSDVPTRIQVTSLPANSTARIQVVGAGNTNINLGTIKIDSKGKLILPPLTKLNAGKSTTIRVVVNGKTYTYSLRAIK